MILFIKDRLLNSTLLPALHPGILTIAIGLVVSNISFIGAAVSIYYFSYLLLVQSKHCLKPLKDESTRRKDVVRAATCRCSFPYWLSSAILRVDAHQAAFIGSLFFIASPSNIFMSSLYTESLFSFVTILGFVFLLSCEFSKSFTLLIVNQNQLRRPFGISKFLLVLSQSTVFYSIIYSSAIVLLSFGIFTRSNGVFSLLPLFFFFLRTSPVIGIPSLHDNILRFSYFSLPVHWCIALISVAIVMFPFISIMGFAFRLYCTTKGSHSAPLSSVASLNTVAYEASLRALQSNFFVNGWSFIQTVLANFDLASTPLHSLHASPRPWCTYTIPNIYKYIQSQYWNVRPFAYWTFSKLDRFSYSIPFYGLSLYFLFASFRLVLNSGNHHRRPVYAPYLGYLVQLLVATVYMGCMGNVEVSLTSDV